MTCLAIITSMEPGSSRHHCLVYQGAPSRHLPAVAQVLHEKLKQNYRCLYLNSPTMVAGLQSYLAMIGVNVARETAKTNLVLSSEQKHLRCGHFDVDAMLRTLEEGLKQALRDGYRGLWATGDMAWEFGLRKDFSKLLEYEWRLEEFFHTHPEIGGVCQYHAGSMPDDALRLGVTAHRSVFINETLSRVNPHYVRPEFFTHEAIERPAFESFLHRLCVSGEIASEVAN
jgi:hypothetical protein